jgi:hypothetical protein
VISRIQRKGLGLGLFDIRVPGGRGVVAPINLRLGTGGDGERQDVTVDE